MKLTNNQLLDSCHHLKGIQNQLYPNLIVGNAMDKVTANRHAFAVRMLEQITKACQEKGIEVAELLAAIPQVKEKDLQKSLFPDKPEGTQSKIHFSTNKNS